MVEPGIVLDDLNREVFPDGNFDVRQLAEWLTPARMVSTVERSPKTNDPCRALV